MLFFCLFQYFEEKEYQTESKQNETFGSVIFLEEYDLESMECMSRNSRGPHEIGGLTSPVGRAPILVGPSGGHRRTSFTYISPYTPKTPKQKIDREFHRRKPL